MNGTDVEQKIELNAEIAFQYIINYFSDLPNFSKTFDMFFSDHKPFNFSGGCGDSRTLHEKIFSYLYPKLEQQVVFGTGKGGYEKYGVKRYIADFYDPIENIIYEIDGSSHNNKISKIKDRIREIFFNDEKGIKIVRIKNKEVEKYLMTTLKNLELEGALSNVFKYRSVS